MMNQVEGSPAKRFVADVVSGVSILAMCVLGVSLLFVFYPPWGIVCVQVLDIRNWTQEVWTGFGAVMLIVLLAIRFWPDRDGKERVSESTGHEDNTSRL